MIKFIRRQRKIISGCIAISMLLQSVPFQVFALTSGPSQPEVQSFQQVGVSDMVDLFTGDFNYNIPLFELPGPNGGYPFNLSYQSGIGMDQEASWVGLGWNLQPGSIMRQMRGLPDEFSPQDEVKTKMSISPSVTVSLGAGGSVEIFGGAGELGLGASIYQNNYKGMGYSIDGTLSFEKTTKGMTGSLSLGVDSKEGVGVNPSLGLGTKIGQFGVGAGYNSKQGLTNVSFQQSIMASSSSSISLANPGYTPQISMPMKNISVSATFKAGGSWWGFTGAAYVSGSYTEQWLDRDKKEVTAKTAGYLNYQDADGKSLLDFNREKDGMVSKETPNLPIPSLTYDIYTVTGQGIGMMYRPMRNDYGVVYDQKIESPSTSAAAGVDVAPAASHVGVNLNVNHSKSVSGKWTDSNGLNSVAEFQDKRVNDLYEPWYFKVHGEPTSEPASRLAGIGGEKAVRAKLINGNSNAAASSTLESRSGEVNPINERSQTRASRNQLVLPIRNQELIQTSTGQSIHPLFNVRFMNESDDEVDYSRASAPGHHFAGLTALTADGLRYVYAIPAYNKKQQEFMYSTIKSAGQTRASATNAGNGDPVLSNHTDKFLKITEIPAYAHAYLLTSIVGPDYVDVNNNGVDAEDLGYWVKFTYKRTSSNFKWRDPYTGAHIMEGWRSDPRDDKASFTYGEKETWYLAKAETKSHIAEFTIEQRGDGRGVSDVFQASASPKGDYVYSLKSIKMYTRAGGPNMPIKSVHFRYTNSLCPNVENAAGGQGKLTLKKLWFEYGTSSRGSLNPYQFNYNNETANVIGYDMDRYDRWGNYKPYPGTDKTYNHDFPYIDQSATKATIDANAAVWSLREIKLPSGATILVDYEADDYAYVQNKTAMQMVGIVDPRDSGTKLNLFPVSSGHLKVRFRLEKSIPVAGANQVAEVMKYIDTKTWQLYFKLNMKLRSAGEGFDEYISGYADIDSRVETMGLELEGSSENYVYGYFHLKSEKGYHPFSMRAWQHLRTNQPELANSGRKLEQTDDTAKRINQIKSLGGIGAQIKQMIDGFYDYCNKKDWGKTIRADRSWVRLNSPDKIKYGGGLRVKQVTVKDNWQDDDEGIYGQVYDYTTKEGSITISSGVAAYEPLVGGDENALRYAKKYVQSIPLRSDNNLFFEYPINESYYPGPTVGYSKVTVMSLPAARLSGKIPLNTTLPDTKNLFPTGNGINYGTSGMTVHEFYTAKDFPVVTDETDKANKQYKLSVQIPFLGNLSIVKLTTSQGYSVVTNDMHGKQKKVSNYRQDKAGNFEPEPISWVKYNYLTERRTVDRENVYQLLNTFTDNGDGTLSIFNPSSTGAKFHMGQEVEMFHDMREFEDRAWGGGISVNTDVLYIPLVFIVVPIPIPTAWPSIGKSTTTLRTAVTNKVIFKSGILESVEAFDGGSLVKTNNLKWDKQTGQVVLTSVNNNFDKPVYTYNRPSYLEYQGMGAAYRNVGVMLEIKNIEQHPFKSELYSFESTFPKALMLPGDEIFLYSIESEFAGPIGKAVYQGEIDGDRIISIDRSLSEGDYRGIIFRSGYRNQLGVGAGTIVALEDPSENLHPVVHKKSVRIPN